MQHLYWLHQLQPHHRSLVGEAAYALGVASQQGSPVLPGVVVGAPLFLQFLESVNWRDPLFSDFPHAPLHMDVGNPSQLQAIAQHIQHVIHSHSLPTDQQEPLFNAIQSLNSSLITLQPSLGLVSTQQTQAKLVKGAIAPLLTNALPLLDTHICRQVDNVTILDTIRQIWSSFFRGNHLFYWHRLGIPFHHLRLALLICPITSALASGTVSVGHQSMDIRAIWGMVSGLKNGDIQPDLYRCQRNSDPHPHINAKRYAHVLPPFLPSPQTQEALISSSSQTDLNADDNLGSMSSQPASEHQPIQAVYHLLSQHRATQPVLSTVLLQHLIDHTQEITNQNITTHQGDWHIEWAVYPTLSIASSVEFTERSGPLQTSQGIDWSNSASILTLMDDDALDLTSLVLDQKKYSVYITQILVASPEPSGVPPTIEMTSAVDIALGQQRAKPMHNSPAMGRTNANSDHSLEIALSNGDESSSSHGELVGIGTSSGRVIAPIWIMEDTALTKQGIPDHYILLTNSLDPVWLNVMQGAKGVISTTGGMTCHAAILARELGIPSVMGVTDAMTRLQTGDWICLDGDRGTVTLLTPAEGQNKVQSTNVESPNMDPKNIESPNIAPQNITQPKPSSSLSATPLSPHPSGPNPDAKNDRDTAYPSPFYPPDPHDPRPIGTATQLMLSLSQTHQLASLAQRSVDGIGLIRAEIMLASSLHHQSIQSWLAPDNRSLLIQTIYHHIKQFAQAFSPRPVWYRTLDMRSHERQFHTPGNIREINPLLGVHGTLSYQQAPGFFLAELEALRRLQMEGIHNINITLPFVRMVEEFQFCDQMIQEMGLDRSDCEVWIMAEVPSILMLLPDYIEAGIQGIAIGSNDLTQMLLATDRTNPMMHRAFEAPHPAVLQAIKSLITTARQANIPCSLCGELASQHPEVIEDLIRWGITTLSVSPDALDQTHCEILRAEKRLFLEWGRNAHS